MLADGQRAERFLALSGMTPETLRAGLADPAGQNAVLGGVLDFLLSYEPYLVAAADALDISPQALAAAREKLV
ncbi:hypothetical protein ABIC78_003093 [Novosphingobium sp. 1529]